jgi:large subunit ribosomal protein L9e
VKTRKVVVKGPKGEITKDFTHMPVELNVVKQAVKKRKGLFVNIKMWFGGSKQSCSVSTLKSIIRNMITGVTNVSLLAVIVLSTWTLDFSPSSN